MNLEIKLFTGYLLKFKLVTKPLFLAIAVPSVAVTMISDSSEAIYFLLGALFVDFVTGICASYLTAKSLNPVVTFRQVISSEKLRKSIVKTATYFIIVLAVFEIDRVLKLRPIKFQSISDVHFTFTFITIGFCIAIELWSIFMENLPLCGFDIVDRLRSVFTGVKKIKNEITE